MSLSRIALVAASALALAGAAPAITFEYNGNKVSGFVVREDEKRLFVRVRLPDGSESELEYLQAKIKVLHRIDSARLEGLHKQGAKAYSAYAEELAKQEADPEALYLARRLYLMAAYLEPEKLGPPALRRMAALAESPGEARRCRAMAFLLDPEAAPGQLAADDAKPAPPTKARADALHDFAKALRSYRTGKPRLAAEMANRPSVAKLFAEAPGVPEHRAFLQMCSAANCRECKGKLTTRCGNCNATGVTRNQFGAAEKCPECKGKKQSECKECDGRGVVTDGSDATVRPLLRAELWATEQLAGGEPLADKDKAPDRRAWSSALQRRKAGPVQPLSLETVTEFDPRKRQYTNGKWDYPLE